MWRGSGKDSFIFGWLYKRKGPVIDTHSNLPFPSFFGTGTGHPFWRFLTAKNPASVFFLDLLFDFQQDVRLHPT